MINQTYNEEETWKLECWNAEMKDIEDQTPMPELQHNVKLIFRYGRGRYSEVWSKFKAWERVRGNIPKGEGATLERDCMTKTIARQHRGYYGSTR